MKYFYNPLDKDAIFNNGYEYKCPAYGCLIIDDLNAGKMLRRFPYLQETTEDKVKTFMAKTTKDKADNIVKAQNEKETQEKEEREARIKAEAEKREIRRKAQEEALRKSLPIKAEEARANKNFKGVDAVKKEVKNV